jgi:hypothetical protein
MATKQDRFPRRFLSAPDLKGKPVTLKIGREYMEELADTTGKKRNKSIMSFKGTDKELVLNVTNFDSIVEATGEHDSEKWSGKKIVLYPTTTQMGGKTLDCIRVRGPAQKEMTLKSAPEPAPEPKPEPETENGDDDTDDEIPF